MNLNFKLTEIAKLSTTFTARSLKKKAHLRKLISKGEKKKAKLACRKSFLIPKSVVRKSELEIGSSYCVCY